MKKFLTVLLALSVVFTYTVGTAFAAGTENVPTTTVKVAVDEKLNGELALVAAAKNKAVVNVKAEGSKIGLPLDKDTKFVVFTSGAIFAIDDIGKIADKVFEDAESLLDGQVKEVYDGAPYADEDALATAIAKIDAGLFANVSTFTAKIKAYKDNVDLSLEYAQDRYEKMVNGIDLDEYSDEKNTTTGKSNRDLVIEEQEKALELIETRKIAYGDASVQLAAQNFMNAIANIDTIVKESYDAEDLAAVKELAISVMTSAYTTEKAALIAAENAVIRDKESTAKDIAEAKENIETITATYDAAMGLLKDQINALTSLNDLTVFGADGNDWEIGTYANGRFKPSPELVNADMQWMVLAVAKAEKIADLKDAAVLAKQFIGIEGSKFFSEAEVEAALEDAIKKVYRAKTENGIANIALDVMTPAEALNARINALIGTEGKATVVVNKTAYQTVNAWKNVDYSYDTEVADAVEALADNTIDALKEATSIEEAEKIFLDAYEKFDAYVTKAEHDKLYVKGGALYEDWTSYVKQIDAAIAAKKIITAGDEDYSYDAVKHNFAANLTEEMYKATTKADLDSRFADAMDTIKNVKTISAIKAEVKALNDRAIAIKDAASADKAEVMAILDGYADLEAYIGTIDTAVNPVMYDSLVKSYLQKIADDEAKAISDAIKAVGKVTVEDKAAIETIVADAEALQDLVDTYGLTTTVPGTDKLKADLSNAEVANVIEMIMKLDTVVTANNVDAAKAAKAAYDALNAAQKVSVDAYSNGLAYDKLIAVLKLVDKYEINAVESMKVVKTHSTAGKGYIKVMWEAVGDETAIDGFQVYKSTKAQTGYTFMGKTTKHYMTNKKGLKKGKRFYYKVRAYKVIDGTKYFSDWSNKANRIAK